MSPEQQARIPVRSVSREVVIDAPVDVVWKALTDAEELTRWFPLEARVTPGVGGSIWMGWDNSDDGGRIEIWEPGRHLRTSGSSGGSVQIATDYYLEARDGGTVLRVVSSGFGSGERWDDLLDAFGSGWDFELGGLRHYLERHRGRTRQVARARAFYTEEYQAAWTRLTSPGGWFGPDGLGAAQVGARYNVRTAAGDTLEGVVRLWQPPRQFAGTVERWNDAMFRAHLYRGDGGGELWLWLSTYGVPVPEVRSLEREWQASLQQLFQNSH